MGLKNTITSLKISENMCSVISEETVILFYLFYQADTY